METGRRKVHELDQQYFRAPNLLKMCLYIRNPIAAFTPNFLFFEHVIVLVAIFQARVVLKPNVIRRTRAFAVSGLKVG